MLQPSRPAFQNNHALHGLPIAPHSRHPFKEGNHQLCVKSLFLVTNEFTHKIFKNKDVPQSLIYVWDIVKARVKYHDLSRIKI
ncbi:MAG: hypothetical protein WC799_00875 [Desulfobacteraceae bacterium]